MRRRYLLVATGSAFIGAGCIGKADQSDESSPSPADASPTSTETGPRRLAIGESATFDDGTLLTVAAPTVQKSIIVDHTQFLSIERGDGLQFVVIEVDGDAEFTPASFALELDGDTEQPPQTQQEIRSVVRSCETTCIGVPVDVQAVESAAIAYRPPGSSRAVWEPGDETVTALSKVPDLQLRDAAFTDQDGDVGVEFTVKNVGERDGGFRALVAPAWMEDVEESFGFAVPTDETVTETVVPSELQRLEPDEVAFQEELHVDMRYFRVESKS